MNKMTKEELVEVKEFENAKEIAKYVYEELTKAELIELMNDTSISNNDVGKYAIDVLLKKNSRVIKTIEGKYQFIIEDW